MNVFKTAAKAVLPSRVRRAIRRVFPYSDPNATTDELRYASYRPLRSRQFINIGAGDFFHPCWTNIDHSSAHYAKDQRHAFVEYDLNNLVPLPLGSSSVSLAYSSHVIEHVKDGAVANLFAEVHRVLEPGGIFRIACPDADLFYLSLELGRAEYWHWRRERFGYRRDVAARDYVAGEIAAPRLEEMDPAEFERNFAALDKRAFLDWLVAPCVFDQQKPGRHINWWNFEKCMTGLEQAGFTLVWRSSFGASLASPMQDVRIFDTTYPVMSLYVEAAKNKGS